MKKLTAILIACAMTLALTGCSSSDYKAAEKLMEDGSYAEAAAAFEAIGDYKDSAEHAVEARTALTSEKIIGVWESEPIDLLGYVRESFADLDGIGDSVDFLLPDSYDLVLIYEFTDNGTFSASIDEGKYSVELEKLLAAAKDGIKQKMLRKIEDTIKETGLTMDNLLDYFDAADTEELVDVTLTETLGISFDEYFDSFSPDTVIDSLTDVLHSSGAYTVNDAEVLLTSGTDSEYAVYDIDSDTLTVTSADTANEASLTEKYPNVYPVVLHRAA